MITYEPFWNLIKENGISTYTLIHKHGVSSSTINRLKHDKPVTTTTINDLCRILDCEVSDVLLYVKD